VGTSWIQAADLPATSSRSHSRLALSIPRRSWPRIDALANYTRTINWETGTSTETFDRKPGLNPASWKYGLGWVGGTPTRKSLRQTHFSSGKYWWSIDGDGPPVAAAPEDAEHYQLDVWMNPPGFIKAARMPGANPKALWRWEQIEKGRDGNVVAPEKVHVVAITVLGKYRMDATINSQNQIQRIKTTVSENAMGDFNIEHESTDQRNVGGVKWPIVWQMPPLTTAWCGSSRDALTKRLAVTRVARGAS
jgi:hypothetical protein